jgi:hypothetical protein
VCCGSQRRLRVRFLRHGCGSVGQRQVDLFGIYRADIRIMYWTMYWSRCRCLFKPWSRQIWQYFILSPPPRCEPPPGGSYLRCVMLLIIIIRLLLQVRLPLYERRGLPEAALLLPHVLHRRRLRASLCLFLRRARGVAQEKKEFRDQSRNCRFQVDGSFSSA